MPLEEDLIFDSSRTNDSLMIHIVSEVARWPSKVNQLYWLRWYLRRSRKILIILVVGKHPPSESHSPLGSELISDDLMAMSYFRGQWLTTRRLGCADVSWRVSGRNLASWMAIIDQRSRRVNSLIRAGSRLGAL